MDVCVVGCGAMGSIYAALLSSAGHNVSVVDTNAEHVRMINEQGLRVWGASGDRTVQVAAHTEPPQTPVELVICAVKARFVEQAAKSFAPLIGPQTKVLTIQNGLGSADVLASRLDANRLVVGVAQGFGASLPAPGVAHHNDMKAIRMGAYAQLPRAEVEEIAAIWRAAGFDAEAVDNIAGMQWEKLICNVAFSAPCAITGLTVGEVLDHPKMFSISRAAAEEAFEVACTLKIPIRFDDPEREIIEFASRMRAAKPSVLLDLELGRISEVAFINGAVPIQARAVGMTAPVNETLTKLVETLEFRHPPV